MTRPRSEVDTCARTREQKWLLLPMSFISRKRMREEGEDRGIRDNRNIVGEKDYTREKKLERRKRLIKVVKTRERVRVGNKREKKRVKQIFNK